MENFARNEGKVTNGRGGGGRCGVGFVIGRWEIVKASLAFPS